MICCKRRIWGCFTLLVVVLLLAPAVLAGGYLWAGREVFAAYAAKALASGVFVAGRTPESIAAQELAVLPCLKYEVDRENRSVTAWIFGSSRRTAVYREGLGAALAQDGDVEALQRQARPELVLDRESAAQQPWPMGDAPSGKPRPPGVDEAALAEAVDGLFGPPSRFLKRHTRAVIVVYDDEIVAERYAAGFEANQRFLGWSMTKSFLHALYGIAVRQGRLRVADTVPFWQGPGDPRAAVTLDMLLRMSSGLDYNEFDFLPPTALTTMIFLKPGAGDFAATLPLGHPPDTTWAYASPGTNILSKVLRHHYGDDAYYALPYQELFGKIGMRSAVLEADASGTFVGSSLMYATARDYARFGLLYQHDGVWQGERILPEGWVEYGRTPTPTAAGGHYGAHWWLISRGERKKAADAGHPLPEDIFFASGFEGQFIVVIPSRKLVIVRLSLDLKAGSPLNMIHAILAAFPETPA
ncbi:MAG TPA: serine hydrolase [Candidatus Hydrogenedentes bacterium]|nr:serine hydrolase [Candidatus Hydrogenedentota bacterium]